MTISYFRRLGCAFLSSLPWIGFAQSGSLDTDFDATATTGKWGLCLVVQPDGKVIAGGTFGLLRLLGDGSVDPAFNPPFAPGQTVNGVALQPDGRVIVRGDITNSSGVRLPGMVRLHPSGSIDSAFQLGSGIHPRGSALAVQSDGKILAAGLYEFSGPGDEQTGLFRLNADGSLDRSYDARWLNSTDPVAALALAPDGKIFFTLDGYTFGIASTFNDGSPNGYFDPNKGIGPWGALAVQRDGKLLVGQGSDGPGFQPLRRLLANGEDDPSWEIPDVGGGDAVVRAIVVQPDGKVIFGGNNMMSVNDVSVPSLARLNADGTLDTTFDAGSGGEAGEHYTVEALALAPNGKLLAAGWHVTLPNYELAPNVWRMNNDIAPQGIEFALANYLVRESERVAHIAVRRTGDASERVSVRCIITPGTASQGRDFAGSAGTLHFRAGETFKHFEVRIKTDKQVEPTETVHLHLTRPNGESLGAMSHAILHIIDN